MQSLARIAASTQVRRLVVAVAVTLLMLAAFAVVRTVETSAGNGRQVAAVRQPPRSSQYVGPCSGHKPRGC